MQCLSIAIELYGSLSVQFINKSKSSIFCGSFILASRKALLSSVIGIPKGLVSFNYLGVPLFKGAPKRCHLQPIADKIKTKFSYWKGSTLSMAGQLCWINSMILSSLLNSFMIYKWPMPLLKDMERCMRNFLWTSNIDHKKMITVS